MLAVDGPRLSHPADRSLVREVQECAGLVDWTSNVEVLFREHNLGLRAAVSDAVSWAISRHGRAIVLEDDCVPGPSLLPFLQHALVKYAEDNRIAHVNGYNLVPRTAMERPGVSTRFTRYIESYAWGTWKRAWDSYDDSLDWALNSSLNEIERVVGSRTAALRWRINFRDASTGRIDTWAYRWMASVWSKGWTVLAPNSNLCGYDGHEEGTHTLRGTRWHDLPVETLSSVASCFDEEPQVDQSAEAWTGRTVFNERLGGLAEGIMASAAMELRRILR